MRTSERDRGKASVYLIEVTVDIASDPEREGGLANWSISKSYRDLAGLDGFVRKLSKVELKQANSFPDKATFKDQTKKVRLFSRRHAHRRQLYRPTIG